MKVIVTGGNSGLGKATAAALAADGHTVIIACRTVAKGEAAAAEMGGDVKVSHLDLADLASVRRFAESTDTADVLINNAGVLGLALTRTIDGFEAHIGTNHLGHFALSCLLADRITDRIVAIGSSSYLLARMHLDDLNWHSRAYSKFAAYEQSKLANFLFVSELTRRGVHAIVADPGIVYSDITRDATGYFRYLRPLLPYIGASTTSAARTVLRAVTTDAPSGSCIAPRFKFWGPPAHKPLAKNATDPTVAAKLWQLSAELTGHDLPTQ
ncbi:retinol dehydrogenase [Mycobacterium colombiense]|uniref:SDR family NAD(P)-dependent oxidoreductase n=1 Tax=Mycobacterium colombiense TaxID=339268 RepID=UPI0007EFCE19|nr:SDR family NAD(P)-dependent oxidoreductase [Mycobacterium colombiense]OBK63093.1 retinol dehydrogenase [Mycobacterium colombiense]